MAGIAEIRSHANSSQDTQQKQPNFARGGGGKQTQTLGGTHALKFPNIAT